MIKIKKTFLAMTLLMTASYSNAGLLTIEINDNGGLSESQYSLFNAGGQPDATRPEPGRRHARDGHVR